MTLRSQNRTASFLVRFRRGWIGLKTTLFTSSKRLEAEYKIRVIASSFRLLFHRSERQDNVCNEETVAQISNSNKNKTDIRWLLQLLLLIVTRRGRRNALKIEISYFIFLFRQNTFFLISLSRISESGQALVNSSSTNLKCTFPAWIYLLYF